MSTELDQPITADFSQAASEIQQRIKALEALSDDDLKPAMDDLKRALMANPTACALMLPEDIGETVKALRRITGQALVAPKTKKEKVPKLQNLTAEQIAELDDF